MVYLPGPLLQWKLTAEVQSWAEIAIALLVLEQAWPQLSLKFLYCSVAWCKSAQILALILL